MKIETGPKKLTLTAASEGFFQAIEPLSNLCSLAWLQCWSHERMRQGRSVQQLWVKCLPPGQNHRDIRTSCSSVPLNSVQIEGESSTQIAFTTIQTGYIKMVAPGLTSMM